MQNRNNYKKAFVKIVTFIIVSALTCAFYQSFSYAESGKTEAKISFTAGQLELISVPSIIFDPQEISTDVESYNSTDVTSNIGVCDLRGSGEGWKLTASLSEFKNNNMSTLENAFIAIDGAKFDPMITSMMAGNQSDPPIANDSVKLVSGGSSVIVFSAERGTGLGLWYLEWLEDKISLTVFPGSALVGTSTATINWSLETTP